MSQAWVTLATNDTYALGAVVLGHSLRRVGTTRRLVVMVTPSVTNGMRELLSAVFDSVRTVDLMNSNDPAHLALLGRPDLGVTFTKLHCWTLTDFDKCVFLDADTLVVANCDELFSHEELTAVPDCGWPSSFNSGVFVFAPSTQTFADLLRLANDQGSFDGGDQGLLNMYFADWYSKPAAFRLPFTYNMTAGASYTYSAAYEFYGKDVKIVHFLGSVKPWQSEAGTSAHHALWWSIMRDSVKPQADQHQVQQAIPKELVQRLAAMPGPSEPPAVLDSEAKVGEMLAQLGSGPAPSTATTAADQRRKWEEGKADFQGEDSWSNIQKQLDQNLPK